MSDGPFRDEMDTLKKNKKKQLYVKDPCYKHITSLAPVIRFSVDEQALVPSCFLTIFQMLALK